MVDMPVIQKARRVLKLAVDLDVERDIAKPIIDKVDALDRQEES
jgi:hypothetical protein